MVGRSNARDQREELDAHRAVGPGAGQRLVVGGAYLGEGGYTDNAAAVASVCLNKLTSSQANRLNKPTSKQATLGSLLMAGGWWLTSMDASVCDAAPLGCPTPSHLRGGVDR